MSKPQAIALITAGILLLIGLILGAVGLFLLRADEEGKYLPRYEEKTHSVTEEFDAIEIDDDEYDIYLHLSTDGSCRVVCHDSEKIYHTVKVENGTLTITRHDDRRWYERFGLFYHRKTELDVYLPASHYRSLTVTNTSGSISLPADFTFDSARLVSVSGWIENHANVSQSLYLKTTSGEIKTSDNGSLDELTAASTSGNIRLSNLAARTISLSTTSGDITLDGAMPDPKTNLAPAKLEVTTTSGDLSLSNIEMDTFYAKAVSGDLKLMRINISETATLKTTSGDIELTLCDAEEWNMITVSGDVKGTITSAKTFITDTTSGHVRVPNSTPSAGICSIRTTSGDIYIEIREWAVT